MTKKIKVWVKYNPGDILAISKRITSEYKTRFFINPDSLQVMDVSNWLYHFLDCRDDEALEDYHGDCEAWFYDCLYFDTLRPCGAVQVIWVPDEDGFNRLLVVDYFSDYEDAENDCEMWGWSFDDGFRKSFPLQAIDLMDAKEEVAIYLISDNAYYKNPKWKKYLYE